MGLMESVTGMAGNLFGGGQNSGIVNAVLQMFTNNKHGGLGGLIQSFQSKGLGNIISSWTGSGQNLPISKEQLREGLGQERINDISANAGEDSESVLSKLTGILPNVVDKLTPDGNVPQDNNMLQQGINAIKKMF